MMNKKKKKSGKREMRKRVKDNEKLNGKHELAKRH